MISLLVFDVDGCLTDGSIIYDALGRESKAFNVKDGLAIASWGRMGLKSAIITGRESSIVAKRAKELNITYLYQGVKDKKSSLESILQKENLDWENVAALGDDFNDLGMLQKVGWSFTPGDGVVGIQKSVDTVLSAYGGKGAAREMVDIIINHENKKEEFLKLWQ